MLSKSLGPPLFLLVGACCPCGGAVSAAAPKGVVVHTTEELEAQTKRALKDVMAQHDLSSWRFTDEVTIDASAIPHSHPVLTLHARYRDEPDRLLLLYIHEQLHWFLDEPQNEAPLAAAKAELAAKYPDHPTKLPEGGFNGDSTLLHLVLCWLELDAGRQLLGDERTRAIMASPHIYSWVYDKVLADDAVVAAIVAKHGLKPKSGAALHR